MVFSSRRAAKASVIAPWVMDCIQRRCSGFLEPEACINIAEDECTLTARIAGIDIAVTSARLIWQCEQVSPCKIRSPSLASILNFSNSSSFFNGLGR
jgi:hypothetical protein